MWSLDFLTPYSHLGGPSVSLPEDRPMGQSRSSVPVVRPGMNTERSSVHSSRPSVGDPDLPLKRPLVRPSVNAASRQVHWSIYFRKGLRAMLKRLVPKSKIKFVFSNPKLKSYLKYYYG